MIQQERMPTRRVPGTLVLAITNLIAFCVVFTPGAWSTVPALRYLNVPWLEVLLISMFLVSAILLFLSTVLRRWSLFNVGTVFSVFVWGNVCGSIFLTFLFNDGVSFIAVGMTFFVLAGQLSMALVPMSPLADK